MQKLTCETFSENIRTWFILIHRIALKPMGILYKHIPRGYQGFLYTKYFTIYISLVNDFIIYVCFIENSFYKSEKLYKTNLALIKFLKNKVSCCSLILL